jgi:hemerythrin-like domain-containing protein
MILTDQLRKENENVRIALRILNRICDKLDSEEQVPPGDLDEIVELIEVLVQRLHQKKEEDLLLATMETSPVDEHGALAALLLDHRAIRKSFQELRESTVRCHSGDQAARPTIIQNARLYDRRLREHLETAESYIYERADMHLSREKQDELMERFDKLERFGADRDAQMRKLLRLRRVYID